MNSAHQTIAFGTASERALSVEVDDAATGASAPYPANTPVVIRLFNRGDSRVSAEPLIGRLGLSARDQALEIKNEEIVVVNSNRILPSKCIAGKWSLRWAGIKGEPGTVSPDGAGGLILGNKVKMGIAVLTYTAMYDRYVLSGVSEGKTVCLFTASDGREANTVIEFNSAGLPKNVTIEVRDYCNEQLISGAIVTVSGNGIVRSGPADVNGLFVCGELPAGHYTLALSAPGYLDNKDDLLANDGFVV